MKYFQASGILPSVLSNWSQRHVAYIAGHGTFGLNNMPFSDVDSVVQYYSVVSTLAVDMINQEVSEADVCGQCIVDLPSSHSEWRKSR